MTYVVDKQVRLTGFEENQVAENTPLSQVSAVYGLRDDVLTTTTGGATVSAADGLFELSSGTSPISIATISTNRPITYRPGQSTCGRITGIFAPALSGLDQIAGLLNTEALVGFAFSGLDFGILQARNGLSENQTLQVTTPAGGSENATITVNGVGYTVALTSGTTAHNAFEIAVSLNSQVPNYSFASNQDTVEASASLPLAAGSFAFTSATAVATWTQVTAGQPQTDTFIPQANWNGGAIPNLNPLNINTYEIVFDGNIQFYVQEQGGDFVLVHTIEWSNTQTELFMRSPSQRVGWGIRNVGNTTNATLKGGYAAGFVQGMFKLDEPPRGDCVTEVNTTNGTEITLLALRNRLTFGGIPNRAIVTMLGLEASSTTNRSLVLKAYINPDLDLTTGDLIFEYGEEDSSIAEVAKDNVELLPGQKPILCFVIQGNALLSKDLSTLNLELLGRDTLVFTGQLSAGAASESNVGINWKEDL